MVVDLSSFKDLYIKTAKENVAVLREGIVKLKQGQSGPEVIEELHRNAHTLKGKSLMMGFQTTGTLSKKLEDIFYEIKKDLRPIGSVNIVFLDEAVQKLQESITNIENNNAELDLSKQLQNLS